MDSELPFLFAKLGFLEDKVARAAAGKPDPVRATLEALRSPEKIESAFEALFASDLERDMDDAVVEWCRRAERWVEGLAPTHSPRAPAAARAADPTALVAAGGRFGGDVTRPPRLSDRYEVGPLLGRGGMGSVYEVHDRDLSRSVALKVLGKASAAAERRFLNEFRAMASLAHPNALPCYGVGRDRDGGLYFTMRKVEGKTLRELLDSLPLERKLRALIDTARAVEHAHERGFLHRDLKPSNVMLGDNGEVWVMDWGLARTRSSAERGTRNDEVESSREKGESENPDEELTVAGSIVGTKGYMAPEQAAGRNDLVGEAADVHGLGGILHEILTGEKPYPGKSLDEIARRMLQGPPELATNAPAPLAAIARKALARKPKDRYPTAAKFRADLEAFLAGQPVSVWREPAVVCAAAWIRRRLVLAASCAVLVFAVLAGATVLAARSMLEEKARFAREKDDARDRSRRLADARTGLSTALEEAGRSHDGRLAALAAYRAPFDEVFEYPPAADDQVELQHARLRALALATFHTAGDPEIARHSEAWQVAMAEARSHLAALAALGGEPEGASDLDIQELEWALEIVSATESATLSSAWIPALGSNEPGFHAEAVRLERELAGPRRLGPDHPSILRARRILAALGTLEIGPIPSGARGRVIEYVTTENPFGRRVVEDPIASDGTRLELPLGSYALEVESAANDRFVFPVLLERDAAIRLDVEIPRTTPPGFVWIPPGAYIEGGRGESAWPRHRRRLGRGFLLSRTEATWGEYIEFLRALSTHEFRRFVPLLVGAGGERIPALSEAFEFTASDVQGAPDKPLFGVSRPMAEAYLAWRSSNDPSFEYYLPAEEEWSRAASGADGRAYPWGDRFDPRLVNGGRPAIYDVSTCDPDRPDRSPFGVVDLAGSLYEWTSSNDGAPPPNAVIRGGYWHSQEAEAQVSYRDRSWPATHLVHLLGFRVAARAKR